MTDRRTAERVNVRLTATYRSEHATAHGVVTCLSRRGLFFTGAPGDEIGTHAVVEVQLADRRLVLQGRVAHHVDHDGIGLHFERPGRPRAAPDRQPGAVGALGPVISGDQRIAAKTLDFVAARLDRRGAESPMPRLVPATSARSVRGRRA